MKEVTFVRVSDGTVVNLEHVTDIYVNDYGYVSYQLQGKPDRNRLGESYASNFLSLVDTHLKEYYDKKVKLRKDREAEEHMRRIRGY